MSAEHEIPKLTAEARDDLVGKLMGTNRRLRQEASHGLAAMAHEDPKLLVGAVHALIDALSLPEALTRWECLDALCAVATVDPDAVSEGFVGAEDALFDEGSAAARLSAFRFIARWGASSPERSLQAWPIMDEALQCYHGDPEYREMLVCLREFVVGNVADSVRQALVERMAFDAKNGRGLVRAYSTEICALAKERG